MQTLRKHHLLHVIFLLTFSFSKSISQQTHKTYCGNIRLQEPFLHEDSTYSSFLKNMVLCKSQKLYFRTSLGLFQISSIDYAKKMLTVSHDSCSSSAHFVSPAHLSAGFPNLPQPNSLLLFNCSGFGVQGLGLHEGYTMSRFLRNCTKRHGCGVASSFLHKHDESAEGASSSCLVVDDTMKLDKDFHPQQLNCTHYSRVYKRSPDDENTDAYQLGTRISFDIPDHVPNPCDECKKPDGNCGVGLKCICHMKECKDKVVSNGVNLNPSGSILLSLLCFILVVDFIKKN